jgi:hypothetical protein
MQGPAIFCNARALSAKFQMTHTKHVVLGRAAVLLLAVVMALTAVSGAVGQSPRNRPTLPRVSRQKINTNFYIPLDVFYTQLYYTISTVM